jgi:uncharacterized protein (DUF302 family)
MPMHGPLSLWTALFTLAAVTIAGAKDGLINKYSGHSANVTVERLEAALKERGLTVFARIDHAAAAAAVGLKMPPAIVVVFGNPRAGTPAFLQQPTLAIDLPLKALVWGDPDGKTFVTYNSADYVFGTIYARHGLQSTPEVKQRTEKLLADVVEAAVK